MTHIENAQSFKTVESCGLQCSIVIHLQLENVRSFTQLAEDALSPNYAISAKKLVATVLLASAPRRENIVANTLQAAKKDKKTMLVVILHCYKPCCL